MMSCSKIAFGFFCKVLWKNPSELFGQPNNWENHTKGNFPDKTVFQFISDLQWKTKSHCGPCAGERISHEDKLKGSWSVRKTDGFSGNPLSLPASGAIRPIDICRHFDLVYPTWIPLSSGSEVFNLSLKNYPPTNQFLNQVKQTEWPRQEKKGKWISVGSGMVSLVYLPRRETLLYKESWWMNWWNPEGFSEVQRTVTVEAGDMFTLICCAIQPWSNSCSVSQSLEIS